jgi:hypothetical protein
MSRTCAQYTDKEALALANSANASNLRGRFEAEYFLDEYRRLLKEVLKHGTNEKKRKRLVVAYNKLLEEEFKIGWRK